MMFKKIPVDVKAICQRKLVSGVGTNNAEYKTSYLDENGSRYVCPVYKIWANMLNRAYNPTSLVRRPTYTKVVVCKEWLLFSTFKSWVLTQNFENLQLDKDIIHPGNLEYSPNKCCFVTNKINNLLNINPKKDSSLPTGVEGVSGKPGKYKSKIYANGKVIFLGGFNSVSGASAAYIKAKVDIIRDVAATIDNAKVAVGLRLHATLLEVGLARKSNDI